MTMRTLIMEQPQPPPQQVPGGREQNLASKENEELPLPIWMQSTYVITQRDGSIRTRDGQRGESLGPGSASRSKFDSSSVKQQLLESKTCDLDRMPLNTSSNSSSNSSSSSSATRINSRNSSRRAGPPPCTPSKPTIRQTSFSTPQPSVKNRVSSTTSHNPLFQTPWRLPKTPHASEYVNTPNTIITPTAQSNKLRPPQMPSSNRKLRSRAVAKLQMLDDQELQASRLVQARQDLLMERQERAYIAWLNHVLIRPSTIGESRTAAAYYTSLKTPPPRPTLTSSNSASSNNSSLKLLDEVYWDEDCLQTSPPRGDSTSCLPGKSPRTPLAPLNGVGNRGLGSPGVAGGVHLFKRSLKDAFSTPSEKRQQVQLQSPAAPAPAAAAATPHLSSRRLKMIREHGMSYPRDAHMLDVCRLSELARRLKLHFSQAEREEILSVITQLAKHIDEGRLRMKKGCAILTDVALRKKALHVLLNYSAYWLRIGLHVVLGHTSLLKEKLKEAAESSKLHGGLGEGTGPGPKEVQDAEFALLEVFLERHFLAHPGLAKKFATNKAIDGLYRDGYSEALGRVILKRFFLLVLVLDKAKCQTTLEITAGIDGVDGGSPSLFRSDARIKSSRQALQEFLSDVMHGEGDVVGNLAALGYQVHHYQVPLIDYDFTVVDLVEDLKDGVRLCRVVQLLVANDTFLLEHIQVPSNGRKRRLHNCQIALESLAQAGVPLEDYEGCSIHAADIVGGNRDKVLPLLWNIMVHLQIPLLVSRPRLCQEIAKLQGTEGGVSLGLNVGTVELLLKWTQVSCMIAGNLSVRNFKTSFADGQALCLIISLYAPVLLPQNAVLQPIASSNQEDYVVGTQGVSTSDVKVGFAASTASTAYKKAVAHNFGLVEEVAFHLGSIPKVLQLVDLLGDPGMSERNIIMFVAFLCSRLLSEKPQVVRREIIAGNGEANLQSYSSDSPVVGFDRAYSVPWRQHEALLCGITPQIQIEMHDLHDHDTIDKICKIQAWWRAALSRKSTWIEREAERKEVQAKWRTFPTQFRTRHDSAVKVQAHWRSYLVMRMLKRWNAAATVIQLRYRIHVHRVEAKEQAARVLQYYFRVWVRKRRYVTTVSNMCKIQALWWAQEARGDFLRERRAVRRIEAEWILYLVRRKFLIAQVLWLEARSAEIIQAHWRGYSTRQWTRIIIINSRQQLSKAETATALKHRSLIHVDHTRWIPQECRDVNFRHVAEIQRQGFALQTRAAKSIQASWRSHAARKRSTLSVLAVEAMVVMQERTSIRIQACWRGHVARRELRALKLAATRIQIQWRETVAAQNKKRLLLLSTLAMQASQIVKARACVRIQGLWRGCAARQRFDMQRSAVKKIQRCWRSFNSGRRDRLFALAAQAAAVVRARRGCIKIQSWWRGYASRRALEIQQRAARKIQTQWTQWRRRRLEIIKIYSSAAIAIQAAWRGRMARESFLSFKMGVFLIQRYVRGYLERQKYQKAKRAVLKIQARYRARAAQTRKDVEALQGSSACKIQAWWRARSCERRYVLQRSAIRKLQRHWWNFSFSRKRLAAAVKIQAGWRAYCIRKVLVEGRAAAAAASLIQRYFRAHLHRKSVARLKNNAVAVIQTHWRAFVQRRQRKQRKAVAAAACIVVQANVRGWFQRRAFVADVCRIRKLQTIWRGNRVRAKYRKQKIAVERIQRAVQLFWAFRRRRLEEEERVAVAATSAAAAAIKIQSVWRACLVQRLLRRQAEACTLIQKQYRSFIQRRSFKSYRHAMEIEVAAAVASASALAAVRIQAAFRRMLQRRRRLQERARAANKIQVAFRTFHVRRKAEQEAEEQQQQQQALGLLRFQSATLIQTAWKTYRLNLSARATHRCGNIVEHQGPEVAEAQCSQTRASCSSSSSAALAVRRNKRRRRRARKMSHELVVAGLMYRRGGRGEEAQQTGTASLSSSPLDQMATPPHQSAVPHTPEENCEAGSGKAAAQAAAALIQSCWRRHHRAGKNVCHEEEDNNNNSNNNNRVEEDDISRCRSTIDEDDESSSQNCNCSLSAAPTKSFSPLEIEAALFIFSCLKGSFAHRTMKMTQLRRKNCATVIQRHVRGWIARLSISRVKESAIVIQAHWRAYVVRRGHSHTKDQQYLEDLRRRMQSTAAAIQESERLCNRLTEALSLLLSQKTVSGTLSTCRTIDVATQHSLHCCERLAECGAITTLLHLIQTINRSPPLEQVLKHALSILNNLARYTPIAAKIAQSPLAISIISEQLHAFRNHEAIFGQAISLLQVVCKTSTGIQTLQRERPVFRRLQLIALSLERKIQVEKRNLERLPWASTAAIMQRRSAQKRLEDANSQLLSIMALMKDINPPVPSHYYQTPTTPFGSVMTPMPRPRRRDMHAASVVSNNNNNVNTPSSQGIRPSALVPNTVMGAKRVSTPLYVQRPPPPASAKAFRRRVTDVPLYDTTNML